MKLFLLTLSSSELSRMHMLFLAIKMKRSAKIVKKENETQGSLHLVFK